jgi:hypothetical protein
MIDEKTCQCEKQQGLRLMVSFLRCALCERKHNTNAQKCGRTRTRRPLRRMEKKKPSRKTKRKSAVPKVLSVHKQRSCASPAVRRHVIVSLICI